MAAVAVEMPAAPPAAPDAVAADSKPAKPKKKKTAFAQRNPFAEEDVAQVFAPGRLYFLYRHDKPEPSDSSSTAGDAAAAPGEGGGEGGGATDAEQIVWVNEAGEEGAPEGAAPPGRRSRLAEHEAAAVAAAQHVVDRMRKNAAERRRARRRARRQKEEAKERKKLQRLAKAGDKEAIAALAIPYPGATFELVEGSTGQRFERIVLRQTCLSDHLCNGYLQGLEYALKHAQTVSGEEGDAPSDVAAAKAAAAAAKGKAKGGKEAKPADKKAGKPSKSVVLGAPALVAAALLAAAPAAAAAPAGAAAPNPQPAAAACSPDLLEAKAQFLSQNPRYGYGGWLDANFESELGVRLCGDHYLDFTGSALYTNSQVRAAAEELTRRGAVYGNPHSTSPSSALAWEEVEAARARVLAHFGADPREYACVFTRSATEALKLVGESLPWVGRRSGSSPAAAAAGDAPTGGGGGCGGFAEGRQPAPRGGGGGGGGGRHVAVSDGSRSTFLYLQSNHKSVLGIGAYARAAGAALACVDERGVDEWLESPLPLGAAGPGGGDAAEGGGARAIASLLAYPAMDNFEGRIYPLDWVDKARARSTRRHRWLTLLDAAAFAPTHPLDLSAHAPDFVALSMYKIMGFPTGVGALLVRRPAAALLSPLYFGGGSTVDATAEGAWAIPLPAADGGLEAGTPSFLAIAELKHGFDLLQTLGGMQGVEAHVESLRAWAHPRLASLRHPNGAPLLRLYGAHARGPGAQGGIFNFTVLRADGAPVAVTQVLRDASAAGLHLRGGCLCNPGACLSALGITAEEERARALGGYTDFVTVLRRGDGGGLRPVVLPTGSVRASLGALSRFEDVHALVGFLERAYAG
ncbi:molybdenum cofactor sulfurase [Raphidocelis subcapitata]|uniref:Molybdenum cofactor sulfurase n=1 Tax=Raphidocelis subcapitata TaxID=307507 RepID=A0A2V0NUK2_9CHLO|nr:molybdenum cofactor sulfurase [Raphidocelis subcapitata]|eukprot:GBF89223.1 molybdenum cofactor sulfurase [Raphidocelis subcapitata]